MNPRSLVFATLVAFASLPLLSVRSIAAADDSMITLEDARAIALGAVPGTVVEEDLEREKRRWVYEFEIDTDAGEVEVSVDAYSGDVVEIEHDDD